jgi:hypothetical protein
MKKIIGLGLVMSSMPLFAFAAPTNLTEFITFLSDTLATGVVPLLVGVAVAAFIYGIIQYFLNPDNEEKRKAGKSYILWGLIALFVMVSFWGIVAMMQDTFVGGVGDSVKMPKLPE